MTIVQGLVSTIIPVYNRPEFLCDAVESVERQSYLRVEIVIVDDGSTDGTLAAAQLLKSNSAIPIKVIHQSNFGPGVARQTGLEASRGEFIQFLDSDDLLLPGKFAAQVAELQHREECGICYGPSAQKTIQ